MVKVKVRVDDDERYPDYYLSTDSKIAPEVELEEYEVDFIKRAIADYNTAQDILKRAVEKS